MNRHFSHAGPADPARDAEPATGTVLVLGASGRLGRHAADAFDAAGWHVRTFARRPLDGADHRVGDVLDAAALGDATDGVDVIVNGLNPPYRRWTREVPALTDAVIAAARGGGATLMLPGNVYAFGETMPARLDGSVPDAPTTTLGRVRAELEARYRAASADGVRTIVVRAGDFVEGVATGAWFEDHLVKRIGAGRMTYPGPLDRDHAWAWLPDLGRAFAALATRRDALEPFHVVGFPGWTLSGRELADALERVLGRSLAVDAMPWPLLRLLAPFSGDIAGVVQMRYLWERAHAIDGTELARLVPDFRATPVDAGLGQAMRRLGVLAEADAGLAAVPGGRS